MALIKLGIIVAAINGKVSGNVFSKGRGGNYVRNWAKPTNPRTASQSSVRSTMTSLSSSWRALSEPQRVAWESQALQRPVTNRLGEQKHLSGMGLYMKQNQFAVANGMARIADAPVAKPIIQYTPVSSAWAASSNGPLIIEVLRSDGEDIFDSPESALIIYLSDPVGLGRKNGEGKRIITVGATSPEVVVLDGLATITIDNSDVVGIVPAGKPGQKQRVSIKPADHDDPWNTIQQNYPVDVIRT